MDKNKNKQNFIYTQDEKIAGILSELGFQKISEHCGVFTFLNTDTIRFSDNLDFSKIHYSNMLCI